MRGFRGSQGISVIELIVTALVLVVLLGIVGNYFAQQTVLNRQNATAAEVQDKVRLVMQLVTQDLQLGGAKSYVDGDGNLLSTGTALSSCPSNGSVDTCLVASDGYANDLISTVYINTLHVPEDACREVGYRFDGDTLQRADRRCNGGAVLLDPISDADAYSDLASNVLALDVEYKCSTGVAFSSYPDSAACPRGAGYLRSAVVSVVAASDARSAEGTPRTFTTVTGQSLTCPQDRRCYSLQQEVLLPNFKDR